MMKRFVTTTAAMAFALSASVALAGTYVTGPLPAEFGGGSVSPNVAAFANEIKASDAGGKLAAAVEKCYSKGASNYSKNKATNVATCLSDSAKGVITKYQASINKINAKAPGIPPCNDAITSGNLVAGLVKNFNAATYCQSPSGAFVDGAANF